MEKVKKKSRLRKVLRLILWVLLIQVVLINISAFSYAYKFTHLYSAEEAKNYTPSANVFAKTWRVFTGERLYKHPVSDKPDTLYQDVQLKTASNLSIAAWYREWLPLESVLDTTCSVSPDPGARGTVILFHGYTGNKSLLIEQADMFRCQGYNVMLIDARDHGASEGTTTTLGYREAEEVKLAYDYVKSKGEKRIFLWGFSMGAVQIMKAIADYDLELAGVILEEPFLSLQSHAKNRVSMQGFPKQPFGFFITFWVGAQRGFNGFNFNTVGYAKKINCPVLLQCGAKDQLVTKEEADQIFKAISSKQKELVVYEDANHESFLHKDPEKWKQHIQKFMEEGTMAE
jgi:alpha-beta hydrolase superfamily lysophospholipase